MASIYFGYTPKSNTKDGWGGLQGVVSTACLNQESDPSNSRMWIPPPSGLPDNHQSQQNLFSNLHNKDFEYMRISWLYRGSLLSFRKNLVTAPPTIRKNLGCWCYTLNPTWTVLMWHTQCKYNIRQLPSQLSWWVGPISNDQSFQIRLMSSLTNWSVNLSLESH